MRKRLKDSLVVQMLVFGVIILLSLAVIFLFNNELIRRKLRENTLALNEKLLVQTENKLKNYSESLNNIAMVMAYSPTTKHFFEQDSLGMVMMQNSLMEVLSNTMLLDEDIVGIYLFDKNKTLLASMGKRLSSERLLVESDESRRFGNLFCPEEGDNYYYTASFPIYDLSSSVYGKKIGTSIFLMKTDGMESMVRGSGATESVGVYLADQNRKIVASSESTQWSILTKELCTTNKNYYVQTHSAGIANWILVSRLPVYELYNDTRSGGTTVKIAYAVACLMICVFIYFCYKKIIQRIHRMDEFIKEVAQNPTARLTDYREDEISRVIHNLNQLLDDKEHMNQEIHDSQKRMYEIQLAKERVQLLAYRNQINPHFLYNTFECISSMALYYDVEEIAEITMALSNVFRFAIKAENIVTIQQEVEYIKEYATIIEYRFMEHISVEIDVDEDVMQNTIIKLILQPIVENAVFHGLEQKMGGGEVTVTIRRKLDNYIMLLVTDNGCGMEKEKVDQLTKSLENNSTESKGIGLANIYQRLKLFYGDDIVFEIKSKPGEGTRVMIVLPDHVEER